MYTILHTAENVLIAELPNIEEGVRYLLTKIGDQVLLHRQPQGQPTTSAALPIQAVEAIYQALHSNG